MNSRRILTLIAIDEYHVRSFFGTGIVNRLLDSGVHLNCIISASSSDLLKGFEEKNVEFHFVEKTKLTWFWLLIITVAAAVFRFSKLRQSTFIYDIGFPLIPRIIARLVSILRFRVLYKTCLFLLKFKRPTTARKYFEKFKPDLVIAGTPGWKLQELDFLIAARQLGIPVLCQILSWDNLNTKGPFLVKPDSIMVWNNRMKEVAIQDFDMHDKDVHVTGAPQFDIYKSLYLDQQRVRVDHFGFHKRFSQIIMLALIPKRVAPFQRAFVHALSSKVQANIFGDDVGLLIRPHPQEDWNWIGLDTNARVKVCKLEGLNVHDDATLVNQRSRYDFLELYESLIVSKVVISVASSMSLDAVAAGAHPVSLAFDPEGVFPQTLIDLYYKTDHFEPLIHSKVFPVCRSWSDLSNQIKLGLLKRENKSKQLGVVWEVVGTKNILASEAQAEFIVRYASDMKSKM